MKRIKGFGAWQGRVAASPVSEEATKSAVGFTSPQCFPQFNSPSRESQRRRSVDCRVADTVREAGEAVVAMRRRSVDDSRPGESMDLQVVRKAWKHSPPTGLLSSSESLSSSSARPSDASVVSWAGFEARDTAWDAARDAAIRGGNGDGIRVVVVGFDAHVKESGVCATVAWTLRNVAMAQGDQLVLVGVMDTVRGPLGYKVQVNDQTWLGANKKFLEAEIISKNLALCGQFRKLCADAGLKLVVRVMAAPRAEVVIVHEATSRGALHVVLDKSLHNKRRRYYLERLTCDVTRMRRSGGVEAFLTVTRSTSNLKELDETLVPSSPTSVLSSHHARPLPAPEPRNSFNSSLTRLVKLVEENHSNTTTSSAQFQPSHSAGRHSNPTIDEEELFCIDHELLTRRVELLLEPEPHVTEHRRHDQLIAMVDDEGYESDDLFSLAGDGASRRPSIAVFGLDSARNSLAGVASSQSQRVTQLPTG